MGRGSSLLGFRRGVHLGVHHGARHGQASKCWPVVQNHVHCATFHHISDDATCQTHVMIHREVKARSGLMPSRGRGLDVAIQKSGRPDGQQCRMNCTILETLAQPPFVCHRDMLEKSNAALSDALQLLSPHMDLSSPKMLSRPRSSTNLC